MPRRITRYLRWLEEETGLASCYISDHSHPTPSQSCAPSLSVAEPGAVRAPSILRAGEAREGEAVSRGCGTGTRGRLKVPARTARSLYLRWSVGLLGVLVPGPWTSFLTSPTISSLRFWIVNKATYIMRLLAESSNIKCVKNLILKSFANEKHVFSFCTYWEKHDALFKL